MTTHTTRKVSLRLAALLACLCTVISTAQSATLLWRQSYFDNSAVTNRRVDFVLTSAATNGGGNISLDGKSYLTDSTGFIGLTNIVGGSYSAQLYGTRTNTMFYFTVPADTNTYNIDALIVLPNQTPGWLPYYTKTSSDANLATGLAAKADKTNTILYGTTTLPGNGSFSALAPDGWALGSTSLGVGYDVRSDATLLLRGDTTVNGALNVTGTISTTNTALTVNKQMKAAGFAATSGNLAGLGSGLTNSAGEFFASTNAILQVSNALALQLSTNVPAGVLTQQYSTLVSFQAGLAANLGASSNVNLSLGTNAAPQATHATNADVSAYVSAAVLTNQVPGTNLTGNLSISGTASIGSTNAPGFIGVASGYGTNNIVLNGTNGLVISRYNAVGSATIPVGADYGTLSAQGELVGYHIVADHVGGVTNGGEMVVAGNYCQGYLLGNWQYGGTPATDRYARTGGSVMVLLGITNSLSEGIGPGDFVVEVAPQGNPGDQIYWTNRFQILSTGGTIIRDRVQITQGLSADTGSFTNGVGVNIGGTPSDFFDALISAGVNGLTIRNTDPRRRATLKYDVANDVIDLSGFTGSATSRGLQIQVGNYTNPTVALLAQYDGRIGIGTTTPAVSLDITNGTLHAGSNWIAGGVSAAGFYGPLQIVAAGTVTLLHGTNQVATSSANTTNVFSLTYRSLNGTLAAVSFSNVVANTSFTIFSQSSSDTNQVDYMILKP